MSTSAFRLAAPVRPRKNPPDHPHPHRLAIRRNLALVHRERLNLAPLQLRQLFLLPRPLVRMRARLSDPRNVLGAARDPGQAGMFTVRDPRRVPARHRPHCPTCTDSKINRNAASFTASSASIRLRPVMSTAVEMYGTLPSG